MDIVEMNFEWILKKHYFLFTSSSSLCEAYESHKVLRRNLLQFLYREELRDFPKKKAQILEFPNKAYP